MGVSLGLALDLGASSTPYDPRNAGTVVADWNPAIASTLTLSGSLVTSIASDGDPSNAGKILSQSDANRPTLNASNANFNGKPTIDFTQLPGLQGGAGGITSVPQPYTWLIVCQINATTGNDQFILAASAGAASNLMYNQGFGKYTFGDGLGHFYQLTTVTPTAPAILAATFNGASSSVYPNALTPVAADLGTLTMSRFALADRISTGRPARASIARALLLSGTTPATVALALRALSQTYGVTLGA